MKRNIFNNIDDVRDWKQLKKDELDLSKLKFSQEKDQFKFDIVSKISKFIMFEIALVLGQKTITSLVKKVLKGVFSESKSKNKKKVNQPSSPTPSS
jgi:hypothetical protein